LGRAPCGVDATGRVGASPGHEVPLWHRWDWSPSLGRGGRDGVVSESEMLTWMRLATAEKHRRAHPPLSPITAVVGSESAAQGRSPSGGVADSVG